MQIREYLDGKVFVTFIDASEAKRVQPATRRARRCVDAGQLQLGEPSDDRFWLVSAARIVREAGSGRGARGRDVAVVVGLRRESGGLSLERVECPWS